MTTPEAKPASNTALKKKAELFPIIVSLTVGSPSV